MGLCKPRIIGNLLLLSALLSPCTWADNGGITPSAFQLVEEEDASPSCAGTIIKVTNATLTDNADGTCSVTTGGGGGNSFETISVPAGTAPVADSSTDTLTITETTFLTITGTAATDTIDITQVTTDLGTDGLIAANAVALTTDTTGNYVASATANEGLTMTGTEGGSLGIQDCAANEIMKRNAGDTAWACAADADSGGATAWDAIGNPAGTGDVVMAETVQTLSWDSAATAAAYDALTLQFTHDSTTDTLTQRGLVVERLATAGTLAFETLVQIQNNDTDGAVTTGLEILSAAGAITTAIDVSDAEIGTALAIGANSLSVLDAALIDLSPINNSTTTEGLILPQGTAPTGGTGDGQIAWDNDTDLLLVGDGVGQVTIGKFLLGCFQNANIGTDQFCGPFTCQCQTSEAAGDVFEVQGTYLVRNFHVEVNTAPGSTKTWDVSLRINGVNCALTCQIADTATECDDDVNSCTLADGDTLATHWDQTNTPTNTGLLSWSAECIAQN